MITNIHSQIQNEQILLMNATLAGFAARDWLLAQGIGCFIVEQFQHILGQAAAHHGINIEYCMVCYFLQFFLSKTPE